MHLNKRVQISVTFQAQMNQSVNTSFAIPSAYHHYINFIALQIET